MEIVRHNLAFGASFALVGIALLVIGFLALDLVTPGKLRDLVWADRNRNATLLTAAMVVGLILVLVGSIVDTAGLVLWRALVSTIVSVVLAITVMMWSFVLVDWLTPGKLGTVLLDDDDHVAGWITAAVFVGIGLIIATTLVV
ncbi:MAG: DUF350 domain-containing protein [Gordonia sp. (in: high G+C Gram-positive bacteria)]